MLKRFVTWVSTESPVIMGALNALVTAWVAFGFRASPAQTAAVTTIGAALVAIVTAFATRPVSVPLIVGSVSTVATAAGAFGLHLTAAQIGAGVPVLSILLALILRQAVTPLVTLKAQHAAEAQACQPEHAVPVVHQVRMATEDMEALAQQLTAAVKRPAARRTT